MRGILIDVTKCTACERCVAACTQRNGLDRWQADRDRAVTPDGLSANRVSTVLKVADHRFARKSCMHCVEPSCVSACLVGSMTKTPEGPVVYNRDKCIGCRYCMLACTFHVPRYQWENTVPYVVKCDMCADRQAHGERPACVEACPEGALKFGDRDQLLSEARALIRQNPRYQDHIWGETEVGGTSMMYISDVDLTSLGWPPHNAPPIPSLTEPLIHKTPFIGLTVGLTAVGLNWIIKRREELAAHAEQEPQPREDCHE
jgi:formate dehydrogenase iron-sulfur subunit